jgi:hypothetical protein
MELVPPQFTETVWHNIQPYLGKACKRSNGQYKPDQMFQDCLAGTRNLLFFFEGDAFKFAAIVSFGDMAEKRVAHLNLVAGHSLDAWIDAIPLFSEWAKKYGAQEITFTGGRAHKRFVPGAKMKSILWGLEI